MHFGTTFDYVVDRKKERIIQKQNTGVVACVTRDLCLQADTGMQAHLIDVCFLMTSEKALQH